MVQSEKLSQIDHKIKSLQDKKKKLADKYNLELVTLMKKVGALSLPEDILIGALLAAVEAFKTDSPSLKGWQSTGRTFFILDRKAQREAREKNEKAGEEKHNLHSFRHTPEPAPQN